MSAEDRWDCGGMGLNCEMRLTSMEPIVEGLMRLGWHEDGWHLWVRHRHSSGLFTDCPEVVYTSLTRVEVQDVLDATVELWGPIGAPRGAETLNEDDYR